MLQTQTTSPQLLQVLRTLMKSDLLSDFRLVGGTALSLLRGHRISDDIDLFTYKTYGSIDFDEIEQSLKILFPYVYNYEDDFPEIKKLKNNLGLNLRVGNNENDAIKVDILNWDAPFIYEIVEEEDIRLASVEEVALMKLDTISRGGRKKDFWDMSEIIESFPLSDLVGNYSQKYPYNSVEDVKSGFTNFLIAEEMPDPICLKGKTWDSVKQEMVREANQL
jgi:hypothetical protein